MGDTKTKNWWFWRIVLFVIFLILSYSLLRMSRQWPSILFSELSAAAAGVSLGWYFMGDSTEIEPYTLSKRLYSGPCFSFFDERSKPLEELKKQTERTLIAAEKDSAKKAEAAKADAGKATEKVAAWEAAEKAADAEDAAKEAADVANKAADAAEEAADAFNKAVEGTTAKKAADAAKKAADAAKEAADAINKAVDGTAAKEAAKEAAKKAADAASKAADAAKKAAKEAARKAAAPKDPPEKVVERMLQPEYTIGQGLMTREEYNDFRNTFLAQSELSLGLIIPILLIIFAWAIKQVENWSMLGTLLPIVLYSCLSSGLLFFMAMERRQKYRIELGLLLLSRWDKQRAADEAAKKAPDKARAKITKGTQKVVKAELKGLGQDLLEVDLNISEEEKKKEADQGNRGQARTSGDGS